MAHKTLTDWARQMITQVRRWLPDRAIVVVADSSYAVLKVLASSAQLAAPVTMITRLRLDAALYDPAPPREKGTRGAPRKKGARQPSLRQRLLDPNSSLYTGRGTVPGAGNSSCPTSRSMAMLSTR